MHLKSVCIALSMLVALAACATHTRNQARDTTFVVVRHAEKASDDPKDPSLNAPGTARARALASHFATTPLSVAYATAFKRTQQNAAPAALASGIDVTTYDAARASGEFVAELRRKHAHGTILVVGHSNTVPEIVAALCSCAVAPLGDADYGDLYEVRIDHNGRATLTERTY